MGKRELALVWSAKVVRRPMNEQGGGSSAFPRTRANAREHHSPVVSMFQHA